jgi:hypothetical protein
LVAFADFVPLAVIEAECGRIGLHTNISRNAAGSEEHPMWALKEEGVAATRLIW